MNSPARVHDDDCDYNDDDDDAANDYDDVVNSLGPVLAPSSVPPAQLQRLSKGPPKGGGEKDQVT